MKRTLFLAIVMILNGHNLMASVMICQVAHNYRYGLMTEDRNDFRINGLNMAYEDYKKSLKRNEEIAKFEYVDSQKDISLLEQLELAKNRGCNLIIGLHTSQNALTAGAWLVRNNILGVSSTATASDMNKYYPNLISAMVPSDQFVKNMLSFIKKKKGKDVYIIRFVDDVYSRIIAAQIKDKITDAIFLDAENGGDLLPQQISKLRASKDALVIFSGFFFPSLPILNQLSDVLKDNIMLGSPEWSFSFKLFIRKDILKILSNLYTTIVWDENSKSTLTKDFIKNYRKKFKLFPHQKTAFSYDTLSMILNCARKSKNLVDKTYECLRSKRSYLGVTGNFEFDGKSSHAIKKVYITRVTADGLVVVE